MAISYFNSAGNSRKKRRHEVGAFGMHLHFANLVDEQLTDMTISDGTLRTNSGTWTLTCCFSAINEDMLLYLAILVYIFAVTNIYPVHVNTNAVSHDYKAFENMVAHATFCLSRRNGVRGIPFDDFFACLLGEFKTNAQRLSSTIIHLLAPLNAEWPKWNLDQNSYECKFGHLFRARNKEWCDLYV
ncbi:hypothetical protein Plhal703r1_c06g0031031 [Plasmopara halstedii]